MSDLSSRVNSLLSNYTVVNNPSQKEGYLKQLKLMMLSFSNLPPHSKNISIEEFELASKLYLNYSKA